MTTMYRKAAPLAHSTLIDHSLCYTYAGFPINPCHMVFIVCSVRRNYYGDNYYGGCAMEYKVGV